MFFKRLMPVLLVFLLMMSVSCKDDEAEKPELDITNTEIDQYANPDVTVGDWTMDSSGNFSYKSINPRNRFDLFFDENIVFYDNIFIYEVYETSAEEPVKKYGYMDFDFNKLTEAISLKPNVFKFGITRIVTEEESYILTKDLRRIEEHYPGFVLLGNNLVKVDWGSRVYYDPLVITDSDLVDYLVPYRIENEMKQNEYLYGFKTVEDAYINETPDEENFVIPAVYQEAKLFYDGIAAVKLEDKWGFIDTEGNVVVECKYDDAISLTNNVAATLEGINDGFRTYYFWNLIDTTGSGLIPETFIMNEEWTPNRFVDGLAFIGGGSFKIITSDGEMLTGWLGYSGDGPPLFSEDYIPLSQTGGVYFYDMTGKPVSQTRYSDARNFSDGMAAVYNHRNKKWGYIDTNFERIISYSYSKATDFSQGYAFVSIDEDNISITPDPGYLIDKHQNKFLEDLQLINMTKFNEDGYALAYAIEVNEYWVNINAHMSKSIKPEWVLETRDDRVYYIIKNENP